MGRQEGEGRKNDRERDERREGEIRERRRKRHGRFDEKQSTKGEDTHVNIKHN